MSKQEEPKITKLNTEYAKEQYAQFQRQHRQVIFKRRRMVFIFAIALVIFAFTGFQLFRDYQRLQSLKEIKVEAQTEAQVASKNVEDLENMVNLLKDEDYVAKLARSKFFYSKEGEQVYVDIPDNTTKDSGTTPSSEESDESNEETNQGN